MDIAVEQKIKTVFEKQKVFFKTNASKPLDFRKSQLKNLRKVFFDYSEAIIEALHVDLGKSRKEAEYAEIQLVIDELD